MSTISHRPAREVQALEEVGLTAVSRGVAVGLALAFALTICGVSLFEPFAPRFDRALAGDESEVSPQWQVFAELAAGADAAWRSLGQERALAVNRSLLAAMDRFEERLEEQSFLRRWLLPRVQWRLAATLGLGNEQVYVGKEGWLFFRPDVDYVTGRGFLDPRVQEGRRRGGEAWLPAPEPDPLPSLLELHRLLQLRRVHLIVMPIPVKPTVEPARFSARARGADRALQNPSFLDLLNRLAESGLDVLDPAPLLVRTGLVTGEDRYLRTDTHWTPAAVEVVASDLAERIRSLDLIPSPEPGSYRRRAVVLEGLGDIAGMLWLPSAQAWIAPERVTAQMVVRRDGKLWRPERSAEILVLGDSFSNVYSDPALGWGASAGLGEQLSFLLQVPVDKLAVNAGGALQTRQLLQRALASGDDRLAGKTVVVYQFAARELAQGDWQIVRLADIDSANR